MTSNHSERRQGAIAVSELGSTRRYPASSYLFSEGEPSTGVLIVESGLVRLERSTSTGRTILIELAAEDRMVGELGVLDDAPRSATCVTLESSLIRTIPRDEFMEAYRSDPELALLVTKRIIKRMKSLTDQLIQASGKSATGRVAGRLIELLNRLPEDERTDPTELRLPISQQELGQWAGLSREGTAKALRELRESSVVTTGRNRITILNQDELQRAARRSG